jgi:hypothetical protein
MTSKGDGSMFYASTSCPTCHRGTVGFCRYQDGTRLGLMCNRCETLYPSPDHLSARHGQYPPHEALADAHPVQWATQNEIELRGWLDSIAGELILVHGD